MTNKISVRQFLTPLIISAALVCVAVPILLPIISQQPQIYTDIILEVTARQNLNRSGELRLLWCLLAASMAIVVWWNFTSAKRQIETKENKRTWNDIIVFLLLGPCFARFLFFSAIDGYMLLLAAFAMTLAAGGILTYRNILLMVVVYFAILAVAAVIMTQNATAPPAIQARLMFLTAFAFAAILLTERYVSKKAAWLAILALQVLIPLLLSYFLYNQYNINGELTEIKFDRGYRFLVRFGIAAAVLCSLYSAYTTFRKNRHAVPSVDDLIMPTTALTIFVFNSVNSPLPQLRDWHHAAENFVPFQQVFDFGKTLYGDYLSASGCFPWVFGFVQRFLLDNTVASYYQAETLLGIVSCAVGGILLNRVFGKKCALFIALSFMACLEYHGLPIYTRAIPILPFLLILMVPGIVANRHLWLQIYVICSMLLGMYYPLYGGAYLLGALPFALAQTRTLLSSKQTSGKKYHIYAWCAVVMLVLFYSPLLLRLARYTLMMSSQSTLANGISIFDHIAPGNFFRLIYNDTIRNVLYFCVAYYLEIFYVIVPLSLCVYYIVFYKNDNKYREISFFAFSFAVIMLPVIYTFSWVRMDYNSFLFRSGPPLSAISIVLFGSLWRYGGAILTRKTIIVCFSLLLAFNCLFSGNPRPHAEKLFSRFAFNKTWQVAAQDIQTRFPRLGSVILRENAIKTINRVQALLEKTRGIPAPILGIPGGQLSYFLFDKEASVTGLVSIFLSTPALQNAIRIMERKPPICFSINSVEQYVLYRWIQDAEYAISGGIAVPKNLAGHMQPAAAPDYSIFHSFADVQNRANALGKSLPSLMPLFDEQSIPLRAQTAQENKTTTVTVDFERNLYGKEADFIFVNLVDHNRPGHWNLKSFFEIDDRQYRMKGKLLPPRLRVRVAWAGDDGVFEDKKSMQMAFGNGRLLLPLGANPWWLNGEAKTLKLEISGDFAVGETVSLNTIKLLQFKPTAQLTVDI